MIQTPRLELVPATPDLVRSALAGPHALKLGLQAEIPDTWPHEYLDAEAFEYFLERVHPGETGWWLHFVVLISGGMNRTLIGSAGYKGPPSIDGVVEVGYGIVSCHRRQGHASEAVWGMVAHAFEVHGVRKVVAETLPELAGSIGVLEKCGFRPVGGGSEPGAIRFELTREDYLDVKRDDDEPS